MKYLLIPLALFLFSLNFLEYNIVENDSDNVIKKKYDPSLIRLNSLDKLEAYTDSLTLAKNILPGTLQYAIEAEDIVGKRFFHKYATQDLDENFIASIAQKTTGYYLSSKITADDILTKAYGYCGQQNTVLMELLLRKKHNYRVVYFPHHFAIESFINGHWYYFDANMEHHILPHQRIDEKLLNNADSFALAYNISTNDALLSVGGAAGYKLGKTNEIQGANAQLFQSVTKIFSKIAFIFPLALFGYLASGRKKAKSQKLSKCKNEQGYFFRLPTKWFNLRHSKRA